MNIVDAIDIFSHYSSQEKLDFLLQLAHALTILARETYKPGEEGLNQPSRMRLLNEIQHRVMGFLIALRKQDSKRYPDDVLIRIVLEHPEDPGLQRQVEDVFSRLMVLAVTA
jgi:hypothetical protein